MQIRWGEVRNWQKGTFLARSYRVLNVFTVQDVGIRGVSRKKKKKKTLLNGGVTIHFLLL